MRYRWDKVEGLTPIALTVTVTPIADFDCKSSGTKNNNIGYIND